MKEQSAVSDQQSAKPERSKLIPKRYMEWLLALTAFGPLYPYVYPLLLAAVSRGIERTPGVIVLSYIQFLSSSQQSRNFQ